MKKYHSSHIYMILTLIVITAGVLWTLGSWLVIRGTEQPAYTVIEKRDGYEVREYVPCIVAEVEVERPSREESIREGFRILADYIFGNNTMSTGIAMTAPVSEGSSAPIAMTAPVMEGASTGGLRKIAFSMPSKYTLDSIPKPNNPGITLRQRPAQRVAVKKFGGYAGDARVQKMEQELLSDLARDGQKTRESPTYAGYDPPLSAPWIRRNEVMVGIAQ